MQAIHKLSFHPPIPPPHVEIIFGPLELPPNRPIAIFADAALATTWSSPLRGTLFPIPRGEKAKSRKVKQQLEDALCKAKFGRDTLIVAIGGGATTDLASFIASTYMRGVDLILVPTTLLGMVDAAIGGKTGINTRYGKNLIGTFYHPKQIFIDPTYLATLPPMEWLNGLAEILKYGLICDAAIWNTCAIHTNDWKTPAILESLILSSIQALLQIIESDPLEQTGLRRILNFGHTVAHALESLFHYQIPHGQAVAIGCIAESFLSCHLGYLSQSAFQEIEPLYRHLGFSLQLPPFHSKSFLKALQLDKKTKEGRIRSVLIDQIGHALPFDGAYCTPIDPTPLTHWLQSHAPHRT